MNEPEVRGYLASIVATVRQPLVVLDNTLRVVLANRAFYHMFQLREEDTAQQLIYDVGQRQWDIPAVRAALADLITSNSAIDDFEMSHEFPTIGPKVLRLSARPLAHNLLLLAIDDVTTPSRAANNTRLIDLFESVSDGFVSYDRDWRYVYVNAAAAELTGMNREQLIGQSLYDLYPDRIDTPIFREYQRVMQEGKPAQLEYFSPGAQRWIRANLYPSAHGLTSFITDITERKRIEEALRESEERFRLLADHMPNLAWMARADGYIEWYNQRWYAYTGTTPAQMEGWGWQSVHDPAVLPQVLEQWRSSIATGQPFEMVFPLKGADGVFRPFLTRVAPVRNAQGEIVQWFGTNTDITAQKELERQKDEFISMVSHELKTPLTSLKGAAQLVQRHAPLQGDARVRRLLATMNRQITTMAQLIDDLLDVARMDGGKLALHPEVFTLGPLIHETVDMVQGTTPTHQVVIEETAGALVWADRDRIGQVLVNLLTNAVKFGPAGGQIRVRLSTEGGQARVSVQDHGIGIGAEHLDKLFDRFYQVSDTTTRPFSGLGIGLYIAADIVRRHGGEIWAESTPGQGSIFSFTLPLQTSCRVAAGACIGKESTIEQATGS